MLILCLLAVSMAGCDSSEQVQDAAATYETIAFETGTVRIVSTTDTVVLPVEIAESDPQRRLGLMRRESLAPDSGMIFLFPREQPATEVFWMFDVYIPLSIAFIGVDGTIANIRDMEPCPSRYSQYCPNYEARVPFASALEVNRGWFAERGISVGDRVVFERE